MRRFILSLLTIVAVATSAVAQPSQHGAARPNASTDARNSFHEFQMKQIEEALKLDGDRLTRFRELYASYNEESRPKRNEGSMQQRRRGGEQPGAQRNAGDATPPKLSEEQIEANIKRSFEDARLSIDTKERYYLLFREFLSPSEINMIYEIERRSRERFVDELQRRGAGNTRR